MENNTEKTLDSIIGKSKAAQDASVKSSHNPSHKLSHQSEKSNPERQSLNLSRTFLNTAPVASEPFLPTLTPTTATMPITIPTTTATKLTDSVPPAAASIEASADTRMRVKKRNGRLEPVDLNKIVNRAKLCSADLTYVDPMRVATRAISGLYDGASTKELDSLCIQTAAMLISEEPEYSRFAARLLNQYIEEEVHGQKIELFSDSIKFGFERGLLSEQTRDFVDAHRDEFNDTIKNSNTQQFEYFGLRTLYDRYLLKNPTTREVIETPQIFFLRVACGLSESAAEAIEFYRLISSMAYLPSTPTLFNSGTRHSQMSSCYLLDSPGDDLSSIYDKYKDVALLSKFAGGIGLAFHRVRSRGSLIKGTNGHSNGVVPWLKTLDSSVAAVNQGGKRKGAACVYLESWHADIEEFLELRDNTGDEARRTHNLNLANWIPNLFMARVERDELWSLFDPKIVPNFTDLYSEEFEAAYTEAESKGLFVKQIKARDLYARMMKSLAQTGNGWMTFKDHSNSKANQTKAPENIIHLSNLCTEILEVTSENEAAVCNLGSVNLAKHVDFERKHFDFNQLRETVRIAVKYLDRVIDINYYPIAQAAGSNSKWRPVGLGVMGLQDVFFMLGLPFDSDEARRLSSQIQEEIYFEALSTSADLAEKSGAHPSFADTRAADGVLQFDLWDVRPKDETRWNALKSRIRRTGLRNSLLIAVAPTATIASIVGSYEAIEPQVSNLFKRETLSGEFIQINRYLVSDLKEKGLWNTQLREKLKHSEGSVQGIDEIPEDLKKIYRTSWELPMKSLIEMAAERGAFIDQSQSLNLFMESPTIGKLSSMYFYAWKMGLKTTYYLRSRGATKINKTAHTSRNPSPENDALSECSGAAAAEKEISATDAVTCSLENPDACEACQ